LVSGEVARLAAAQGGGSALEAAGRQRGAAFSRLGGGRESAHFRCCDRLLIEVLRGAGRDD